MGSDGSRLAGGHAVESVGTEYSRLNALFTGNSFFDEMIMVDASYTIIESLNTLAKALSGMPGRKSLV
jgi:hypothetical protein